MFHDYATVHEIILKQYTQTLILMSLFLKYEFTELHTEYNSVEEKIKFCGTKYNGTDDFFIFSILKDLQLSVWFFFQLFEDGPEYWYILIKQWPANCFT